MDIFLIKPSFNEEKNKAKVKDAWNTCNPNFVEQAYTIDSRWCNRIEFFNSREIIIEFFKRK